MLIEVELDPARRLVIVQILLEYLIHERVREEHARGVWDCDRELSDGLVAERVVGPVAECLGEGGEDQKQDRDQQ